MPLRETGAALPALLLWLAIQPAVAQPGPDKDLDCSELAALEPLLATGAPDRSHFLGVEDLYHRLILDWTAGQSAAAAANLSDLEQRLSERASCLGEVLVMFRDDLPAAGRDRPGRLFMGETAHREGLLSPFICLAAIEGRNLEPLFERRPAALLATARFYQRKHGHQLRQERLANARRSREQVEEMIAAYTGSLGKTADLRVAATVLALVAVDLAELNTVSTHGKAAALLHRALELDPEHRLALYLAGLYEEKLADYGHARSHFSTLARRVPDDPEPALRLAINQRRTGDRGKARERLEELTAVQPDWIAIVATQELAGLLAEEGDTTAAADHLREAIARFPGNNQLQLQLARLLHHDWRSAWPLIDGVLSGWRADAGDGARLRYEIGRPGWIAAIAAALDASLAPEEAAIREQIGSLATEPEHRRALDTLRVASLCHGSLPLRRLPTDPGEGTFAPDSPGYDG